jgi:putative ABC transport system ATP-binding protein
LVFFKENKLSIPTAFQQTKGIQNDTTSIRMNQVVKVYTGQAGSVQALKGINLEMKRGEFLAVTGRSGSGKTTLVNMLTGLDRLTSGEVWVDDVPVHNLNEEQAAGWRGQNVGIVFQSFHLIPTLTALQNVTLPMDFCHHGSLCERQERGIDLLTQLGLKDHIHKRPSQVSGGQQQRIAIARALSNDPQLIVADEPTGSLDSGTAREVFKIFADLALQGKKVLVVTHDFDLAQRANRIYVLVDGELSPIQQY